MKKQYTIFSIGNFDFQLSHLMIILILSLSFSISFMIRSLPAQYGWELNEYDPFFNYRATEFLVENGITEYFNWNDDLSWYPHGRDVSSNSQVILHLTAALTYYISGSDNLYDHTIIFPVVFGSFTTIAIFALVRVIGGTSAGLIASILFSVSLPIFVRGQLGWFKSEPLGIFFGIIAMYLFLSAINTKNYKFSLTKFVFAGILTIVGLSAWGGNQFFLIVIGIFIFTLPFIKKDNKLLFGIPIFVLSTIITALCFERPGFPFVYGLGGFSLILPTIFLIISIFIKIKSKSSNSTRNIAIVLAIILISSSIIFTLTYFENFLPGFSTSTHRYINAIYPLLTTSDPLTDSVSEHATLSIQQSFTFHTVLMIFAAIGIWISFTNNKKLLIIQNNTFTFTLIIGLFGIYIGSAYMRLEVFSAISIIILSSIGISQIFSSSFKHKKDIGKNISKVIKFSIMSGIIILLIIPFYLPESSNIFATGNSFPPTILNGGTSFNIATNDWIEAMMWIKNNSHDDAVIGSWWDYGYWIQTLGNRASIADNSTLIDQRIKNIAEIFFMTPSNAWTSLSSIESDYFVVFVAGERLPFETDTNEIIYLLGGGGDESKIYWFGKIAGVNLDEYLENDSFNRKSKFWDETFLGKIIPFRQIGYANFQNDQYSPEYIPGWKSIFIYEPKFVENNSPFELVYSSTSMRNTESGPILGVFVYKLNSGFVP